tara:strand:+ start:892 stop:1164 length:273 start_codon:yes stop_codon:yes gene_type:complete
MAAGDSYPSTGLNKRNYIHLLPWPTPHPIVMTLFYFRTIEICGDMVCCFIAGEIVDLVPVIFILSFIGYETLIGSLFLAMADESAYHLEY